MHHWGSATATQLDSSDHAKEPPSMATCSTSIQGRPCPRPCILIGTCFQEEEARDSVSQNEDTCAAVTAKLQTPGETHVNASSLKTFLPPRQSGGVQRSKTRGFQKVLKYKVLSAVPNLFRLRVMPPTLLNDAFDRESATRGK
jgi:hypothetical protein